MPPALELFLHQSSTRADVNRLDASDRAAHDWYRFVLSFPPHLVRDYLARFSVDQTATTLVKCRTADRLTVTGVEWSAKTYDDWGTTVSPARYHKVSLFQEAIEKLCGRPSFSELSCPLFSRRIVMWWRQRLKQFWITNCRSLLSGRRARLSCQRLFAKEMVVVDSESTDGTQAIAEAAGARVVQFAWKGKFPQKKNWALESVPWQHECVLIVDADERITPELQREIRKAICRRPGVDGFYLNCRFWFLEGWTNHCGYFLAGAYACFGIGLDDMNRLKQATTFS